MERETLRMQMAVQLLLEYLLAQKDTLLDRLADQQAPRGHGNGEGMKPRATYETSSSASSSSSGIPGSSSTSN